MDEAEQIEALYALQDALEPDRELLEAPYQGRAKKTGREHRGANDQIPVYLETDIYCYFKPINGVDATTADALGHTIISATLAECAAWRLAHALGGVFEEIVVPQVLRQLDDVDPLAPGALCRRREGKPQSDEPFAKVREQCLAAAFFDSLIGQQDRNKNNWLWHAASGEFRLIDHGFAFARPEDTFVNLRFTRWRWGKKEQQLVGNEVEALKMLLSSDDCLGLRRFLDEDRCTALEARATEMWRTRALMPVGEF